MAWQTLEQDFGRQELVVNTQLKLIHSYRFIKAHHSSLVIIKCSQVVSGCVNALTPYEYESVIPLVSVLNNAMKKLPIVLEKKWPSHLQRLDSTYKSMRMISSCLKNFALKQENNRLQLGNASDKTKPTTNRDRDTTKTTGFCDYNGLLNEMQTLVPVKLCEIW